MRSSIVSSQWWPQGLRCSEFKFRRVTSVRGGGRGEDCQNYFGVWGRNPGVWDESLNGVGVRGWLLSPVFSSPFAELLPGSTGSVTISGQLPTLMPFPAPGSWGYVLQSSFNYHFQLEDLQFCLIVLSFSLYPWVILHSGSPQNIFPKRYSSMSFTC